MNSTLAELSLFAKDPSFVDLAQLCIFGCGGGQVVQGFLVIEPDVFVECAFECDSFECSPGSVRSVQQERRLLLNQVQREHVRIPNSICPGHLGLKEWKELSISALESLLGLQTGNGQTSVLCLHCLLQDLIVSVVLLACHLSEEAASGVSSDIALIGSVDLSLLKCTLGPKNLMFRS